MILSICLIFWPKNWPVVVMLWCALHIFALQSKFCWIFGLIFKDKPRRKYRCSLFQIEESNGFNLMITNWGHHHNRSCYEDGLFQAQRVLGASHNLLIFFLLNFFFISRGRSPDHLTHECNQSQHMHNQVHVACHAQWSSHRTKSSELRQGPTLPTHPRDQSSCPGTRVCGLETVTLSELSVSGEVLHGKQLITSCLLLQNDDNVPNRFPKTQELGNMFQTGFRLSAQLFRNSLQIIQLIQTIQISHILICADFTNISSESTNFLALIAVSTYYWSTTHHPFPTTFSDHTSPQQHWA